MSVSVIEPHAALIVVDLQKGVVATPTAHDMKGVVANAAQLARAFRAHGLPVVLVTATGGAPGRTEAGRNQPTREWPADFAELVPELDAQPEDVRVTKRTWGAFRDTSLDEDLRWRGVTQVVVTGVATTAGVESTARAAHEAGYHVVLATDAMTDRSGDAHDHSVRHVFPRVGETGTTAEILELLGTSE